MKYNVYGKTVKNKMCFWDERDIFRLMNNSVYDKTRKKKIMTKWDTKRTFWDEKEAKRILKKLPFYNAFIGKPRINYLKIINLLHDFPFYNELSIKQIS